MAPNDQISVDTDRDTGYYIGRLKALLQLDEFERDEDKGASMNWTDSDLLAKVAAQVPAETAQLMRDIIQAIEDPDSVPKLDRDPQWIAQQPIPTDPPMPDQSFDIGA